MLLLSLCVPSSGFAQARSDIFIVGHDVLPGCNPCNPLLIRADRDGQVLWEKPIPLLRWGGDHQRYGDRNLAEDALYLSSHLPEDQVGGLNRLLKLDADGDVVWDVLLSPAQLYLSADPVRGGVFAVESGTAGGRLFKLDGAGAVVWTATDPDMDAACSISADPTTGGVYIGDCGSWRVLKFDSSGAVVWKASLPDGPSVVNANPLDGGVYVGYGHYRRFTRRLDADGNVIWQKDYFPSPWTYGRAVSPIDGALFVGSGWPGQLACAGMDGSVVFNIPRPNYNANLAAASDEAAVYVGDYAERGVFKYDAAGNLIWNRLYGPPTWIGRYGIVGVYTGMPAALLEVAIDIQPGSDRNCLNLNGHGVIPVAVLGSAGFDVLEIDPLTLSFAGLGVRVKGNGTPQCSYGDVSGDFSSPDGFPDGFLDMVCQFVDDPDAWQAEQDTASLSGELYDGVAFEGEDEICRVP
jgi:hypothetical protein